MTSLLIGLATLARLAFEQKPLTPISDGLLARLAVTPNDAHALLDLSVVLYLSDRSELAFATQREALSIQRVYELPNTLGLPVTKTLRLLAFLTPGDLTRNTAIEFLVEGTPVTLWLCYVEAGRPLPTDIPAHDIAFVAVCESSENRAVLDHLSGLISDWPKPVINPPQVLLSMGRDAISRRLEAVPGVLSPMTLYVDRANLFRLGKGEIPMVLQDWPLIVRPLDSHKGMGLVRLGAALEFLPYLTIYPDQAFFIAPFMDYRSADGLYRKYRVVLIDGVPYVCHLCMSEHWILHYMSAGMAELTPQGAAKRQEEAMCFAEFDQPNGFGTRHRHDFLAIYQTIDLPYIGLDCGEMPNGDLLVFEVDCGMTVHNMDSSDLFPYKPPQMRKVFDAFYQMLCRHAGR